MPMTPSFFNFTHQQRRTTTHYSPMRLLDLVPFSRYRRERTATTTLPQGDDQSTTAKRQLLDYNNAVQPARKRVKHTKTSVLEWLPAEIFCQVLSFVGPTSTSLVALSEVNKYMNKTMNAIGKAMLPRAHSNFRVPLQARSPMESCTSLFLRHSRTCCKVLTELTQLRVRLNQHISDMADVDQAMAMALRLLEVGPTVSVSLERQILSTAGKCGGKAFKFTKSLVLQNLARDISHDDHQDRLDTARLVMQIVVFRDLQIAQELSSANLTSLVQNQQVMKKAMNVFSSSNHT